LDATRSGVTVMRGMVVPAAGRRSPAVTIGLNLQAERVLTT
jgi:hypothetical protein